MISQYTCICSTANMAKEKNMLTSASIDPENLVISVLILCLIPIYIYTMSSGYENLHIWDLWPLILHVHWNILHFVLESSFDSNNLILKCLMVCKMTRNRLYIIVYYMLTWACNVLLPCESVLCCIFIWEVEILFLVSIWLCHRGGLNCN